MEAERAVVKLHNQKLDKAHVFHVCLFSDWQKFKDTPAEYQPAEESDQTLQDGLQQWLLDDNAREQYLVRHNEETEVWWHDPIALTKQDLAKKRENWTDLLARWSPLGSYMLTFHKQGIQMWGGPDLERIGRFAHSGVQLIDFSPKERFLVTWYSNLAIWETKTQRRLRSFPGGPTPEHGWPVFKWSHDESYFAKITEDNIHIFDSSTMTLIQPDPKKPTTLYLPGVRSFEWCPNDNLISYWIPEMGDLPARVAMVRVVATGNSFSFEMVTQKNLFRVLDIRMHWQSEGHFLCVKVDRYSKNSKMKEKVTSFELFRMQADGAVEVVELHEEVVAFAWEPKGVRFAVIHGNNPARYNVSFYTMGESVGGHVKCLNTLSKKTVNHLFWSPKGTHIVLAGLKSFNGNLEFYNVNMMELTGGGEHFMCTDVEWDPSGRYVSSSVSYYRHQMENGYTIWSFQGKQLLALSREKFLQFAWRPRPASLLSDERLRQISKSLGKRVAKYQKGEKVLERQEAEAFSKHRREKMDEFKAFLAERAAQLKPLTARRREQRRNCNYASDDESCFRYVEDYVEELISVEEEEMGH
eukprot:NODE_56_length_2190_cov_645.855675_g47_i0.p1 GENE.NODE_56_length_2190_cov_645.855675_g47_i0~~NODE_56_length_2190_cov_645.855675_g47_i0.p1  ORF type:complete len:668 (+),score=304.87 NODE_56_length_2190_cov_645.855675_g47_i0:260-2005(+)